MAEDPGCSENVADCDDIAPMGSGCSENFAAELAELGSVDIIQMIICRYIYIYRYTLTMF